MNIIIKKNYLLYKGYKLKCSIGKSGVKNFKKEGDLATPRGLVKLGLLYYRKDRIKSIKSIIKKKIIKKNMGWCDDSRSKKYNQEIYFPFKYRAEKLYRSDNIFDIILVLSFNIRPVIKKKAAGVISCGLFGFVYLFLNYQIFTNPLTHRRS